jgi:hypothetical protein
MKMLNFVVLIADHSRLIILRQNLAESAHYISNILTRLKNAKIVHLGALIVTAFSLERCHHARLAIKILYMTIRLGNASFLATRLLSLTMTRTPARVALMEST